MGNTTYTQEPWVREGRVIEAKDVANNVIMQISVIGDKADADLQLIAVAPEMFENLRWAEAMLTILKDVLPNPDTYESYMSGVRKIRSIIDRAVRL